MKWLFSLLLLSMFLLAGCSTELPPEPTAPGATGNYYKAIGDWATQSDTFWLDFDETIECSRGENVDLTFRVDGDDFVYQDMYLWLDNSGNWDAESFDEPVISSSSWISGDASLSQSVACENLLDLADENNDVFAVAYSCSRDGTEFDCNDNKWQLQVFSVAESSDFKLTASNTSLYAVSYPRTRYSLISAGQTFLDWAEVPGALCYDIYNKGTNIISDETSEGYVTYSTCWNQEFSVTNYHASGLSPDNIFTYTIIAKDENGFNISKSNEVVISFDNWCVDSDRRHVNYIFGSAADSNDHQYNSDFCIDEFTLAEQSCSVRSTGEGIRYVSNVTCDFGCVDGACVNLDTPNLPGDKDSPLDTFGAKLNVPVTKQYSGNEYVFNVVGASSQGISGSSSIILSVNGQRQTISEGEQVSLGGLYILVNQIYVTDVPELSASAEISVLGIVNTEVLKVVPGDTLNISLDAVSEISYLGKEYGISIIGANSDSTKKEIIVEVSDLGQVSTFKQTLSEGDTLSIGDLGFEVTDIYITNIPSLETFAQIRFVDTFIEDQNVCPPGYSMYDETYLNGCYTQCSGTLPAGAITNNKVGGYALVGSSSVWFEADEDTSFMAGIEGSGILEGCEYVLN